MAETKENALMEKIVSLCKRRGFIYQSSEIYGGINGFWDYGPLGAELKRNVKELWWSSMTRMRDDVVGLEATIIMSPRIWEASGHVATFADMMRECPFTKKRVRADQVDPQSGIAYTFQAAGESEPIEALLKHFPNDRDQTIKRMFSFNQLEKAEGQIEYPLNVTEGQKAAFEVAVNLITVDPVTVLVPLGKPVESARKQAKEYFRAKGIKEPFLFGESPGQTIKDSIDYHPESGFKMGNARPFNLMFKTYVGPLESEDNVAYLRPETAQAIFAQFQNVLVTSRQKVPFGIAQIGKAFRNEVTPRNYTFRSREFEQMELEFFIKPDEAVEAIAGHVATAAEIGNRQSAIENSNWGWEAWHKYWVEERVRFYEGIGLPRNTLVEYWQKPEELAHYARATVDILFKFPFSKRDEKGELKGEELEGIAARSDFDLSQHARFSGKTMGVFDEELRAAWGKLPKEKQDDLWRRYYENRKRYLIKTGIEAEKASAQATEDANGLAKGQYIPHVIEPSAGVDRLILALITNAYFEDELPDDKGKMETRVVLKFHPRVAPIKVGIMPLLKNKPELVNKALEVRDLLRPWMNVYFDDAGAIGRRYRRQDEAGTPFCVTIDFDTLGEKPELKDTVTIRYRDDGKQERLPISGLLDWLLPKIR